MNKYVMKKTVIKALREEPLMAGAFSENEYDPNCKVCAVGAVLRRCGFDGLEIDRFGDKLINNGPITSVSVDYFSMEKLLKEKKYLNALSVQFEYYATMTGTGKRTRETMVKFVERNFPNRISLYIK